MLANLYWGAGWGLDWAVVDPGLGVVSRMGGGRGCENPWTNISSFLHFFLVMLPCYCTSNMFDYAKKLLCPMG